MEELCLTVPDPIPRPIHTHSQVNPQVPKVSKVMSQAGERMEAGAPSLITAMAHQAAAYWPSSPWASCLLVATGIPHASSLLGLEAKQSFRYHRVIYYFLPCQIVLKCGLIARQPSPSFKDAETELLIKDTLPGLGWTSFLLASCSLLVTSSFPFSAFFLGYNQLISSA